MELGVQIKKTKDLSIHSESKNVFLSNNEEKHLLNLKLKIFYKILIEKK